MVTHREIARVMQLISRGTMSTFTIFHAEVKYYIRVCIHNPRVRVQMVQRLSGVLCILRGEIASEGINFSNLAARRAEAGTVSRRRSAGLTCRCEGAFLNVQVKVSSPDGN